jgi:DNA-binding response OmpR family regulator
MPRPKKVLICDDEPYIVESVSYVVRKAGYTVVVAEDGEEALEAGLREKPELVFLDIMMPRMTGYEVCRRLKEDPETRDTYIIMLTARGQEEDERKALEMGADEFMTKPFSPRKMRAKLIEILGDGETTNHANGKKNKRD